MSKHTIPAYYCHDRKVWVTSALLEKLAFALFHSAGKIFLDCSDLQGIHNIRATMLPNVKAVHLSLNLAALIQPMDQGTTP
jgi:hypothetical protein